MAGTAEGDTYNVLVLGTNRIVIEALAGLLSSVDGWWGTAYVVAGSTTPVISCHLDIIVAQVENGDGRDEWMTRVRQEWPTVPLVLVCPEHGPGAQRRVTQLGAAGSVTLQITPPELVTALTEARERGIITRRLSEGAHQPRIHRLTARQLEIVQLIAAGHPSEEVATTLGISPNTVRTHVQNIMAKLEAHSRLEIVTCAYRTGLIMRPS